MSTWTEEDKAKLRAAIASGLRAVEYDGPPKRRVEYQDLSAMRQALADMEASTSTAPRRRYASHSKGF